MQNLLRFGFVVESGEKSKRTFTLKHDDTFPVEQFTAEHAEKHDELERLKRLYYRIPDKERKTYDEARHERYSRK